MLRPRLIFISYRRSDSRNITRKIYDLLAKKFGYETVFRDLDSIPAGESFKEYIERELSQCQILIAVIGPTWLEVTDRDGSRRLDDPKDWVRLEIEFALNRGIRVIPLLINDTQMPQADVLSGSLKVLPTRNAARMRHTFRLRRRDVTRLINDIESLLESSKAVFATTSFHSGETFINEPTQKLPSKIWLVLGSLAMIGWLGILTQAYLSRQRSRQPVAHTSPADPLPIRQPAVVNSLTDTSSSEADLLSQADALWTPGQPQAALDFYDQAIARSPDSAAAHWGRCYILNKLQRFDEAIAACDQALTFDSNNPKALSSKGYALNQQQRYSEALDLFDQAIALQPDNPETLSNRGAALLMLDRPTEAVEAFDQAIELQPELAEAWSNRGAALWSLRRFDEAISSIDRAIELQPDFPGALRLRQQIRDKLGR